MNTGYAASAQAFFRWWGGELKALLPQSAKRARTQGLVVSVEPDRMRLVRCGDPRDGSLAETAETGERGIEALRPALVEHASRGAGLRFHRDFLFSRVVELPAQAEPNFANILSLDLERATPFRSADVMTAHFILPEPGSRRGVRRVCHLVLKRSTAEPILAAMRRAGVEPAFIEGWDETLCGGLPADFLEPARKGADRAIPALASLACVLAITAATMFIVRHHNALAEIGEAVEAARGNAAAARQAAELTQRETARLATLERMARTRLAVADIVEELTLTLPDDVWLTDLRMELDRVEITGFAPSASALVPLLERSGAFENAALTAPVVLNTEENKERFSIRVQLEGRDEQPEAATAREGSP